MRGARSTSASRCRHHSKTTSAAAPVVTASLRLLALDQLRSRTRRDRRETLLTGTKVTTDAALRAADEALMVADEKREHSPLAKLIPGYYRLP
jgi:hypothetical protein